MSDAQLINRFCGHGLVLRPMATGVTVAGGSGTLARTVELIRAKAVGQPSHVF